MAGRIAGITIEIGGDTSNLQKSLKGVDSQLKKTQSNLKDINKLLKLDPTNTELLVQKQKNLENAVKETKDRLTQLKEAQKGVAEGTAEWDALQREIIATEQDLKKAEQELRNFGSVGAQQLKAVGSQLQTLGGKVEAVGKKLSIMSGAAAGALVGLGKIAYNSMQSADELATLSQQTGVTVEQLQKWSYASDLVDVSLESMTGAMKKMKKGMDGNADAFANLGVQVRNADGSFRNTTDVFYDTLKALSKIDNETERDIVAMEIFGKSADELAGIIDDGGDALKAFGEEAEEAGLIMSDDMVKSLNEANNTIDRTKQDISRSLGQLGGTLITTFGPALKKVTGFIGNFTEVLRNMNPETAETVVKILGIIAVIGPLVIGIGKIISAIGTISKVFGGLMSSIGGPWTIIIAAVIALGVLIYKNWDVIKAKAIELKDKVVEVWTIVKNKVVEVATAIKDWVVNAWNTIVTAVTTAVNAVKNVVTTVWEAIKTAVMTVVNGIVTAVTTAWNAVKNAVTTVTEGIKTGVTTAWNGIKSAVSTVANGIKSTVTTAWNGIKNAVTTLDAAMKSSAESNWNTMKSVVTTAAEGLKTGAVAAWEGMKSAFASVSNGIQNKIDSLKQKFETLKNAIKNVIDKIKSIFNTTLNFPHIKIPHFIITGGEVPWGIGGKGTPPTIDIQWYKKAYENPVMFTSPTVMPTLGGMKGFGDGSGAEIVMGLDKLRELVGAQANQPVVVNVSLEGDARGIFRVVQKTNTVRTKATNYNALAVGG